MHLVYYPGCSFVIFGSSWFSSVGSSALPVVVHDPCHSLLLDMSLLTVLNFSFVCYKVCKWFGFGAVHLVRSTCSLLLGCLSHVFMIHSTDQSISNIKLQTHTFTHIHTQFKKKESEREKFNWKSLSLFLSISISNYFIGMFVYTKYWQSINYG